MKNSKKFFAIALLITGFSAQSSAQSSATATATATIVAPLTITKTVDLDFGNVAAGASAGTLELAPDGTRTAGGGVTLPAIVGNVTPATFDVTGDGSLTYAITLPASVLLTQVSGTETMTADNFTSMPSGTGALLAGLQVLTVGATLNVNANQAPGTYVSGTPFTVTVNYN
jgi:hypothetical protein